MSSVMTRRSPRSSSIAASRPRISSSLARARSSFAFTCAAKPSMSRVKPWMFASVSPMRAASSASPSVFLRDSTSSSLQLARGRSSRARRPPRSSARAPRPARGTCATWFSRGLPLHVELEDLLVRLHELGLHRVDEVDLPGDRAVGRLDGPGELLAALPLLFQARLALLLVLEQALQAQELDLELDLEDLVAQRPVGLRLLGLGLQGVVAAPHLLEDALDVAHVLLGLLELPLGLLAPHAESRDARRLLEDVAPFLGLVGEQLVDLALLHDGVGRLADARVEEQLAHVAELHGVVVDEVLALPRAVQPPADGHLGQVEGEDLVLVGDAAGSPRRRSGACASRCPRR